MVAPNSIENHWFTIVSIEHAGCDELGLVSNTYVYIFIIILLERKIY